MTGYLRRRTVAFTVRIWAEYLEQNPPSWRGEVACIGSERQVVFTDLDRLFEFLQGEAVATLASTPADEQTQGPKRA